MQRRKSTLPQVSTQLFEKGKQAYSYSLEDDEIGQGGFGTVYKAVHNQTQKVVALKRVLPQYAEDETFIGMFREEAARC